MYGSTDTFQSMHNSHICNGSRCCMLSQGASKHGMNASDGTYEAECGELNSIDTFSLARSGPDYPIAARVKCLLDYGPYLDALGAEDGDGMRQSACSTNVFSEMGTLESIPTSSDMGLLDDALSENPLLQELPQNGLLTPGNDVAARSAAVRWRGVTLRSAEADTVQRDSLATRSKFNVRKLQMPKKKEEKDSQGKDSEEANATIKENSIELDRRPIEFLFLSAPWEPSDAGIGLVDEYDEQSSLSSDTFVVENHQCCMSAGKTSEDMLLSGMSRIDEKACGEVPDDKKVMSNECLPGTAPSKQSSNLDTLERSTATHLMPDMSLAVGYSVMVGSAGRALRRKRTLAPLV